MSPQEDPTVSQGRESNVAETSFGEEESQMQPSAAFLEDTSFREHIAGGSIASPGPHAMSTTLPGLQPQGTGLRKRGRGSPMVKDDTTENGALVDDSDYDSDDPNRKKRKTLLCGLRQFSLCIPLSWWNNSASGNSTPTSLVAVRSNSSEWSSPSALDPSATSAALAPSPRSNVTVPNETQPQSLSSAFVLPTVAPNDTTALPIVTSSGDQEDKSVGLLEASDGNGKALTLWFKKGSSSCCDLMDLIFCCGKIAKLQKHVDTLEEENSELKERAGLLEGDNQELVELNSNLHQTNHQQVEQLKTMNFSEMWSEARMEELEDHNASLYGEIVGLKAIVDGQDLLFQLEVKRSNKLEKRSNKLETYVFKTLTNTTKGEFSAAVSHAYVLLNCERNAAISKEVKQYKANNPNNERLFQRHPVLNKSATFRKLKGNKNSLPGMYGSISHLCELITGDRNVENHNVAEETLGETRQAADNMFNRVAKKRTRDKQLNRKSSEEFEGIVTILFQRAAKELRGRAKPSDILDSKKA